MPAHRPSYDTRTMNAALEYIADPERQTVRQLSGTHNVSRFDILHAIALMTADTAPRFDTYDPDFTDPDCGQFDNLDQYP